MSTVKIHPKIITAALILVLGIAGLTGCSLEGFATPTDGLKISIEAGTEWLHPFPLLGPISKKNAPTFAVWITDQSGAYIDTVYVSRKMGLGAWIANDDNRPEALPAWVHARGAQPDAGDPVPDEVTGATPRDSSSIIITPKTGFDRFTIWLEVNHSIDYNQSYPEDLDDPSAAGYSGGSGGSGQPALVYRVDVDMIADRGNRKEMNLIGHSEPGGAGTGTVYADLSGLTSALGIVKKVTLDIN